MALAAEVSPAQVLELFEAGVPRARPSALYAVEAWEIPVSRKIIPSFQLLEIEACKAEAAARPALEAQQARTSAPFYIEVCRTRVAIPFAPEIRIVPFPQEEFPTSVAFDIEADKAQASVSPAPAAGQARPSASFDIGPWKVRVVFPPAPVPQELFPTSLPF
jgi:hypothetical protein